MITGILAIISAAQGSALLGTGIGIATKVVPMLPWFKGYKRLGIAKRIFKRRHARSPTCEEVESAMYVVGD